MDALLDILFSPPVVLLFALMASFFSMALFVYSLMPDAKVSAAKKMLGVVDDEKRENKIFLLKLLHPVLQALAKPIQDFDHEFIEAYRNTRRKQIIAADLKREITPDEFIAFKIVMMVVFPVLLQYLSTIAAYPLGKWTYLIVTIAGFFAPDLWLYELLKKRQRAIFRSLPYVMDILTLSVEAGLDFIAAIQRVTARAQPGPLLDELKIMLNEISLGTSRSEALRNISERVQMEELGSFTTLLIQADQMGASIGPVLRAQSDSLRVTRFQRAEQKGARSSQAILFPMVFCIFPAIFIIILGPLMVRLMTQGIGGLF